MAKLYFKYGAMGSSKTAQALITKFNYEERGMDVWLLKPSVDCRDGETLLRSRIGLEATADVPTSSCNHDLIADTVRREAVGTDSGDSTWCLQRWITI